MAEFVTDRMSHITPTNHWCDIIVLYVHASTGDKSDDGFYETFLGDLILKVGKEFLINNWELEFT